ncbi:MAG TPA: hypothetical protein PKE51_08620 [Gemmatimonadaceae bacterium]|nr:hypothetical protein [Gemmatimonadaceae bacterium]
MTQRLQVLLDDSEFDEIRRIAQRHHMTVAEWVRQALRAARRDEAGAEPQRKLVVLREAARHAYPTAGIEQMLDEIEGGRFAGEDA